MRVCVCGVCGMVCVCVCVCVWCVCVCVCERACVHATCVQFFGEDSLISTITHVHSPNEVCSLCVCTPAAALLCGPRCVCA